MIKIICRAFLHVVLIDCQFLVVCAAAAAMDMNNRGITSTLEALLPTVVTVEQAHCLFDLMPGMEYCTYDQQSGQLAPSTVWFY